MFALRCPVRDYSWGSSTLLADLEGRTPTGRPEAEVWMGAHPGAPSLAVLPDDGTQVPLDALLAQDPAGLLGSAERFGRLPFLVKLLAAGQPLSIQAHPTLEQARAGYAAEEQAGVPADAPHRNYKDDNHKPEMVVALTPFSALCGFRDTEASARSFERLAQVLTEYGDGATSPEAASAAHLSLKLYGGRLQEVFSALLDPSGGWAGGDWVEAAVGALNHAPDVLEDDLNLATAVGIAEHFPGDPGVMVSLLLHRVDLAPGQAIFLPAGNVHAYLHGLGVEVMAASDNVLRGGLTGKHVDVPELERVVVFEPMPVPYLNSSSGAEGHQRFAPPVEEFEVERLDLPAAEGRALTAHGPVIAVCVAGSVQVRSSGLDGQAAQTLTLAPGESVFLRADDAQTTVHAVAGGEHEGTATVFSVTVPALS